jgi:hypothetical protein
MAMMSDDATATSATTFGGETRPLAWQRIDRWIFVFMAVFILATVLTGFIPASLGKIAAVEAGQRPPFPPVLHVHAVLMGSWVLLLLAQTGLVASNLRRLHQRLGLVSLVLMPAMVVTGFVLVPDRFQEIWALDPTVIPPDAIAARKALLANIALMQIRAGILFPTLVIWALLLRKTDPGTHKRLLILATLLPLTAAFDRIGWLPLVRPYSPDAYLMLWTLPLFAYDLLRHGRVPRAYLIWIGLLLPLTIPVYLLHDSPWWLATAPRLMGVAN